MNEDMMNMVQKMSEMMGNKEIPSEIKNILNSMNMNNVNNMENINDKSNANNNNFKKDENDCCDSSRNNDQNNNFSDFMGNIDFNTILKIQEIMKSLKDDKQNDYRTNLLMALKPYVRESRKGKVDTYIQLMKMGKIIQGFNSAGGENQSE